MQKNAQKSKIKSKSTNVSLRQGWRRYVVLAIIDLHQQKSTPRRALLSLEMTPPSKNTTGVEMWLLVVVNLLHLQSCSFSLFVAWSKSTNITPWHEEQRQSFPSTMSLLATTDSLWLCSMALWSRWRRVCFPQIKRNVLLPDHMIPQPGSLFYSHWGLNEQMQLDEIRPLIYKVGCCYGNLAWHRCAITVWDISEKTHFDQIPVKPGQGSDLELESPWLCRLSRSTRGCSNRWDDETFLQNHFILRCT